MGLTRVLDATLFGICRRTVVAFACEFTAASISEEGTIKIWGLPALRVGKKK